MTSTARKFSEVRATEGIIIEKADYLAFRGVGAYRTAAYCSQVRHGINQNHPNYLHVRSSRVDGVMAGTVKVTRLKNTIGTWFSLRSEGRTVYLRADALVVIAGFTRTIGELYAACA